MIDFVANTTFNGAGTAAVIAANTVTIQPKHEPRQPAFIALRI